ncbi:MAG TPA: tRNA pseudouridine(55) synthase TruB [Candidatus Eisenbacteria bacterium]|nr:tRNA pseudouridine(55) synthase TruB [Candidatus Eisenbacteria bacterium]
MTSFGVVHRLRRLTGVRRVGHGGTLDPAADGVLPVLIGPATRLTELVHEWPKTYRATLQLGATSTTYDAEGVVTQRSDPRQVNEPMITALLPDFVGHIAQVPPLYSALKVGGEPLYRKARRGETVALAARPVEIIGMELRSYDQGAGRAVIHVQCGRGAYVRSLAHDLGARLGCGAYLAALTRTAVGPLQLADAVPLETLEQAGTTWERWLLALDLPLRHWAAITVDAAQALVLGHGQPLGPQPVAAGRYRIVDETGRLLAWGVVDVTGRFRPAGVFPP